MRITSPETILLWEKITMSSWAVNQGMRNSFQELRNDGTGGLQRQLAWRSELGYLLTLTTQLIFTCGHGQTTSQTSVGQGSVTVTGR
jgi:hypothetical protein